MLLMLMPACPLTNIPERLCRTGISVNGQAVDHKCSDRFPLVESFTLLVVGLFVGFACTRSLISVVVHGAVLQKQLMHAYVSTIHDITTFQYQQFSAKYAQCNSHNPFSKS
jgi:hypothetical protein